MNFNSKAIGDKYLQESKAHIRKDMLDISLIKSKVSSNDGKSAY